jgi:hypothetical protein
VFKGLPKEFKNPEPRSNHEQSIPKYRGADLDRVGARLFAAVGAKAEVAKRTAGHPGGPVGEDTG